MKASGDLQGAQAANLDGDFVGEFEAREKGGDDGINGNTNHLLVSEQCSQIYQ